jgi:tetratricopeptide (TPR) repeat protein
MPSNGLAHNPPRLSCRSLVRTEFEEDLLMQRYQASRSSAKLPALNGLACMGMAPSHRLHPLWLFRNGRMAAALIQQGSHGSAVAQMEDVVQVTRRLPLRLSMLGHCYASAGRRGDALRVVQELNELSPRRYISAYWPAIIYASLNETNEALRCLEQRIRSGRLGWFTQNIGLGSTVCATIVASMIYCGE